MEILDDLLENVSCLLQEWQVNGSASRGLSWHMNPFMGNAPCGNELLESFRQK